MDPLNQILAQARAVQKTIVLPEGEDARVAQAAKEVEAQGLAKIILLGEKTPPPLTLCQINQAAEAIQQARARRGKDITKQEAQNLIKDPLMLSMGLVASGIADGCVAGATHATADVVRAALQIVGVAGEAYRMAGGKSAEGNLVSSFFIMLPSEHSQTLRQAFVFADCAIVVTPDAKQLARIALETAANARALFGEGFQPRVALLSFSTAGSATHPQVDKIRDAGEIIARIRPDLELMPEVQFDAAVSTEILQRKAPQMKTPAPANIFIFPDLQSANIGYKIAERLAGIRTVGPILQGLNRPVNDLSRGCSSEDIVRLTAITAVQAIVPPHRIRLATVFASL